jgi:predicted AlkP superfamily pyrophosphatase or phosphodiesterase
MIRNKIIRISLLSATLILTFLLVSFRGLTTTRHKSTKSYVLLVSFDAFRWDYSKIYKTPNLNKMAKEGVKADRLISSFPTVTFPNHYSIATGLYPDHHGLVNNTFYAPDLNLLYRIGDRKAIENPAFYGGEPIWVTAKKQGLKTASFFWVGSEAPVEGIQPDYWKKYDANVTYTERIDTVVKWLGYPDGKRPELVTLYFDEPDATSHDFGPVSPETGEVVNYLDSMLGVLRTKLSQLLVFKKLNLIVLSDHGMSQLSSEKYIDLKSIVPERMISGIWGGNPVYLIKPAEGKADSLLLLINRTKGVRAWRKGSLPEKWHYGTNPRIPEVVAVADSSWYISTRPFIGTLTGGAHGYDNHNSDMFAIFYAAGPAFKKAYSVKEFNNVDVYDLICRILDLKPSKNDGDISHVEGMLK